MPPVSSKKNKTRDSHSRNTTPVSTGSTEQSQSHVAPMASSNVPQMSYDDILEYAGGSSPPGVATLRKIWDNLKLRSEVVKGLSDECDRGMRQMSKRKKELQETIREQELADREEEEARNEKQKRQKLRKEQDEERPLAVGAHSLARQDGGEGGTRMAAAAAAAAERSSPLPVQPVPADSTIDPQTAKSPSTASDDSHQPAPALPIPQFQTFGPDPSTFDDPTIYHIHDVTPGMTDEEKQIIYGVAQYPHDNLHDLTPGTPPDRDFSNAKPPNQATASTFANYLEPYVRPFTEEDVAFLRERGDRTAPFVIPRRGLRSYKEIWAEEDNASYQDNLQSQTNLDADTMPSGNMELMNDEVAETSEISTGPMMARLLSMMRPERRPPATDAATGGIGEPMRAQSTLPEADGAETNHDDQSTRALPPATYMAESTQPGWKNALPKLDYAQLDERVKQELRYIGFLSEDAEPDYAGHHDDEVAARLRWLQEELQRVVIENGARKARLLEIVEERMAQQEWSTIADDLDTQLNQAYLKRHRNIGKGKKNPKKPGLGSGGGAGGSANGGVLGAATGAGVSKPSVGEPIRSLMERRTQWTNVIGPVVEYGKSSIPTATIFDADNMGRLRTKERENWADAQDHV